MKNEVQSPHIVSSETRHRIRFSPDPNNTAYPTAPEFVASRLIRDIEKFPAGVRYVVFDSVVEVKMMSLPEVIFGGKHGVLLHTEPFNDSDTFVVAYSPAEAEKIRGNDWVEVAVHESLKGKIWVFGNAQQAELQKLMAA